MVLWLGYYVHNYGIMVRLLCTQLTHKTQKLPTYKSIPNITFTKLPFLVL